MRSDENGCPLRSAEKALLHKQLLAAKTEQEAAEIATRFLGAKFDERHPLAMFIGGHTKQTLVKIPSEIHREFHSLVREELQAAGLSLPIGGKKGSTEMWAKYFRDNPGLQGKAFDATLKISRAMDAKHGTEITGQVWKNLVGNQFFVPARRPYPEPIDVLIVPCALPLATNH